VLAEVCLERGQIGYVFRGVSAVPIPLLSGTRAVPSSSRYECLFAPVYNPNDTAITGNPTVGPDQNYGLNDVWGRLQGAANNLLPQNYSLTWLRATWLRAGSPRGPWGA
jgi:hypothetical protein